MLSRLSTFCLQIYASPLPWAARATFPSQFVNYKVSREAYNFEQYFFSYVNKRFTR